MLDNSQLIFAATESKIYAKEFDPILESTRSDIPPLFVYLQRLHNLSAMMWMPLFLILLPLAADGWYFRRHRKAYRYRNLLLTLVAAGDLLPLAGIVLFWLVKDNTSGVVTAAMWIFFAYLLLTLPRMAYYAVRTFGKGRATRILAPIAALGMAGALIHGAVSGRRTLAVHRVTLRSDRLPEAFDGLRIAQFTDLHIGTLVDPDREMRALVDSLNALRPDLVIFCGDLVNIRYTELDSTAMRLLGGIRSRYGTFSITGNHDTGNYVRDTLSLPPATNIAALVERQRAMGWRVLDNETVYLRRGDDSIALSGISYDRSLARQRHDRTLPGYDFGTTYCDVPQELYNITAAHIPQLWEQILDAGYGDLTLSGHVHSMQCKIRLFGRAFSPAQLMYSHWSGPYEKQGRTLYVNDGIGYVGFPMRIGANPEITLFELRR